MFIVVLVIAMSRISLKKTYNLTKLKWTEVKQGSTDGILPKTTVEYNGVKYYLKTGSYSKPFGFYGIEPIIELINSRIGKILGFPVLNYSLISATVKMEDITLDTLISVSRDYAKGKQQISFEKFYNVYAIKYDKGIESTIDFCKRFDIIDLIYQQFVFDYIICNYDRHEKNTEILIDREGKIHLAPFFDNSLTFITNRPENEIKNKVPFNESMRVRDFIGTMNLRENLSLIDSVVRVRQPKQEDREMLFQGLSKVTTREFRDFTWNLLIRRVESVKQSGISFIQWY